MEEIDVSVTKMNPSYRKIFFARKHFWNRWQGFEVNTPEDKKAWEETHKGWKKCRVFHDNIINIPNVPVKEWSLQNKEAGV